MYLVSIYFDEKADKRIREYIRLAAKRSGNHFMISGNVPPHMTISAFEIKDRNGPAVCGEENFQMSQERRGILEGEIVAALEGCVRNLQKGTVQWVSVGTFFPGVLFLSPVLNQYLLGLSEQIYECLSGMEAVEISRFYKPYQWLPHTTIAKTLDKEEMKLAFGAMQECFGMFGAEVIRIGLAKTNPYEEIINWDIGFLHK